MPIIEPEVLMDGDHTIERCEAVTEATLREVFAALAAARRRDPNVARLRLHFFGTSNLRTADASPRVMPIAREYGLDEFVTEQPARLDYFDALGVLVESDAVLVLGSSHRHSIRYVTVQFLKQLRTSILAFNATSRVPTSLVLLTTKSCHLCWRPLSAVQQVRPCNHYH